MLMKEIKEKGGEKKTQQTRKREKASKEGSRLGGAELPHKPVGS